jgi:hypothetical protein
MEEIVFFRRVTLSVFGRKRYRRITEWTEQGELRSAFGDGFNFFTVGHEFRASGKIPVEEFHLRNCGWIGFEEKRAFFRWFVENREAIKGLVPKIPLRRAEERVRIVPMSSERSETIPEAVDRIGNRKHEEEVSEPSETRLRMEQRQSGRTVYENGGNDRERKVFVQFQERESEDISRRRQYGV